MTTNQQPMNLTTITPTADGRVTVTVDLWDGTLDTIEAHDLDTAIRFSHMHLAYSAYTTRYGI